MNESRTESLFHEVLLWVDVETTGLDPQADHLLEVAAVLTTFDSDFTQIGLPFERVAALPDIPFAAINQTVLEMHVTSGLWEACRTSRATPQILRDELERWLRVTRNNADIAYDTPMHPAGRSVHFDLDWIPDLGFHHRRFDLTPVKAYANLCGFSFGVPEDAHRALADVEADIELARRLVAIGGHYAR